MRVLLYIFLAAGLVGCTERKDDPGCNPRISQDIYRAKCYMEGNLIYDADVVCLAYIHPGSIEPYMAYDKQSGSKVYLRGDELKCFVLRKTE